MRCHVCGKKGNNGLTQPMGYIPSAKATCVEIAINTYKKTDLTSSACSEMQKKFVKCCDGTKLPYKPAQKPNPPKTTHIGPYPVCNLCQTGTYPKDPSHIINLLYVGQASCKDYYIAGREGRILPHLCDPLRYFAKGPCGCPKNAARSMTISPATSILDIISVTLSCAMLLVVIKHVFFKLRQR